ncbi:MAG: PEP-CTERM sorting domain-containing protein [Planctomycetales bacterium]|nr:PEP-CTERM sorting domain-containing protein [Planctomycetales bacterium]
MMMKNRISVTLALVALLAFVAGSAQATTIGFVGAAGVNADLPVGYASNIAADGAGWTTSDGTGATPDVALYWGGAPDTTGWDWEFHSAGTFEFVEALNAGGAWDAVSPPGTNAVAQFQHQYTAPHEIKFSVPAGVAVILNSFDIGNATDQTLAESPYGFDIALIRDSDTATVWSHSTPLWDATVAKGGTGGIREESVPVNYTGDLGESYTLRFTAVYGSTVTSAQTWRTGLDNLSFSQVPEPTSLALAALCGLGIVVRRRRS